MSNPELKVPSYYLYNLPASVLSVLGKHKVSISSYLILPPEACGIKVNFPLTTLSLQTARFETPSGDTLVINSTYATANSAGTDDSGWLAYQTLAWASGSIVAFFITQDALKNTRVFDHVLSVLAELEKTQRSAGLSLQETTEQTPDTPELWEATFRDWINSAFGAENVLETARPKKAPKSSKSTGFRHGEILKFTVFTDRHEFKIRSMYSAGSRSPGLTLKCTSIRRTIVPGESIRIQDDGPAGAFSEAVFKEIIAWMLRMSLVPLGIKVPESPANVMEADDDDDD